MRRPKGPARKKGRYLSRRIGGVLFWWWVDPWRGLSPPRPSPPCHDDGCDNCRSFNRGMWEMKRPEVRAGGESPTLVRVEVPKQLAKLPTVAELLCQPAWEDGSPKGDRCVFVFVSATLVKLLVKVGNPPLKLMVPGRSWDEAWAALEAVLRGEDTPWEQDDSSSAGGGKKKK